VGFPFTTDQPNFMELGLSIVICTHNGKNRLEKVLEHINCLHIPDDLFWEVLVVDNASTDDTTDWVYNSSLTQVWNFKISLFQEPTPGLNVARLTGARSAKYDWLLFCDDDNLLDSNYVQIWFEVITTYQNLGAVGGRGISKTEIPLPDWFNDFSHSYAVGPQFEKTGFIRQGSALYGAGLFVLKTPVLNIINSGFKMVMSDRESGKLTSGGDLEWCYLLQLAGLHLYYDERMIFEHKISSKRLHWDYYIQLKSGIASGVGLLESYHFIFKRGYESTFFFILHYSYQITLSTLIFYSFWIKSKIFRIHKMDDKNSLGLSILQSKASSYISKFRSSFIHYRSLKNTFNAVV
jgi:glycosyltransferase involved in cell wall biosynthesis